MSADERPLHELLAALQERAKELTCLYQVDDILGRSGSSVDEALQGVVDAIPPGWQYPEISQARLEFRHRVFRTSGYEDSQWALSTPLIADGKPVGTLTVSYTAEKPERDEGPFLAEERRLLTTLAERIGHYLTRNRDGEPEEDSPDDAFPATGRHEWSVILEFLRQTDRGLLLRVARRMINDLCWHGVDEALALIREFSSAQAERDEDLTYENRPSVRREMMETDELIRRTFDIAERQLSEQGIIRRIQQWINEDKTGNLAAILERPDSPLEAIATALDKYQQSMVDESQLTQAVQSQLRVSLLRRFFLERLDFLNSARPHVRVRHFPELVHRIVAPTRGQGRLGGKSAGLFVASKIVAEAAESNEVLRGIRIPNTWYVSSDAILEFIRSNELEDLYNRKYMPIEQVRQDYPHIVQLFKNSRFPSELTRGLSMALDEFEHRPLIVRSSSLLEDGTGAAFSGKYKSLFLANQGTKRQRLEALQDAIAEVYASVFGPDPIQYRAERGLLDVHEEMGIMIQEVVGQRAGDWFLPSYSGVAFSTNEFRWSPRIQRSDGLVRMVPGLGTRAVDRLSDDYPVMLAPGQPGLRVNATPDEVARYSPRKLDVINLGTGQFETVVFEEFLREVGRDYPGVHRVVSRWKDGRLTRPMAIGADYKADDHVVTFDSLISDTPFVSRIHALLEVLEDNLGYPVDLEFASDGQDMFLLQCRAQSYAHEAAPAPIPRDLPHKSVLFTAKRHISNGRAANLTHIVYVDPTGYDDLHNRDSLLRVARAIGRLNQTLPKRQFILIGPGRWGSRGDIKLGVPVTYSDINNTAVLSEVARKRGGTSPDLSFGTHFFQDLVEAGIRYLPLYPDEEDNVFDEIFLTRSGNLLPQLAPEFADLADVVRVIDVAQAADGRFLHVLMNGELGEAVGCFGEPLQSSGSQQLEVRTADPVSEEHWRWREFMVERVAAALDRERFGVQQFYVFGSTENGTAGPGSDIDVLIHFRGTETQRNELELWLNGWSCALAQMNYLRTGYQAEWLLDVHLVTDEDIAKRSSFAVKINAITDAARPLLPS